MPSGVCPTSAFILDNCFLSFLKHPKTYSNCFKHFHTNSLTEEFPNPAVCSPIILPESGKLQLFSDEKKCPAELLVATILPVAMKFAFRRFSPQRSSFSRRAAGDRRAAWPVMASNPKTQHLLEFLESDTLKTCKNNNLTA